jgi:hypothetical protein
MSDVRPIIHPLDTDLAELRSALRAVEAPPPDEAAVRAVFRDAARSRADSAARSKTLRRTRVAAVAVIFVAVAGVLAVLVDGSRSPPAPSQAAALPAAPFFVEAFQPLQNAPRISPASSYSVVRVRIPVSAFATVPGSEEGGTIEADLLVGEDGLARGIRFIEADAWLASAEQ